MTGHSLAPVGEADIGEMARIHSLSFDDAWSGAMFRRILATRGTWGIAARHGRAVSGFALLRLAADECELLTIAVAPERRSAGLGMLLLRAALEQARERGARKLFLEVADDNLIARRLYRSQGLRPVGRRRAYYCRADGTSADALTMLCELGDQAFRTTSL